MGFGSYFCHTLLTRPWHDGKSSLTAQPGVPCSPYNKLYYTCDRAYLVALVVMLQHTLDFCKAYMTYNRPPLRAQETEMVRSCICATELVVKDFLHVNLCIYTYKLLPVVSLIDHNHDLGTSNGQFCSCQLCFAIYTGCNNIIAEEPMRSERVMNIGHTPGVSAPGLTEQQLSNGFAGSLEGPIFAVHDPVILPMCTVPKSPHDNALD